MLTFCVLVNILLLLGMDKYKEIYIVIEPFIGTKETAQGICDFLNQYEFTTIEGEPFTPKLINKIVKHFTLKTESPN